MAEAAGRKRSTPKPLPLSHATLWGGGAGVLGALTVVGLALVLGVVQIGDCTVPNHIPQPPSTINTAVPVCPSCPAPETCQPCAKCEPPVALPPPTPPTSCPDPPACPTCKECVDCSQSVVSTGGGGDGESGVEFSVATLHRPGRYIASGMMGRDLSMKGVLKLPSPSGKAASTTIILNLFKRTTYLPRQLEAVLAQTVPLTEVWVCLFAVGGNELGKFQSTLSRYAPKFAAKNIALKRVSSDINFKYYGRFQVALQVSTKYVWTLDDDILPQPRFHEAMLKVMHSADLEAGLLGSSGWYLPSPERGGGFNWAGGRWSGAVGRDYYAGAHLGAPDGRPTLTEVDFLTTQQFCESQTLRALFQQHVPTLDTGEDIVLAHVVRSLLHKRVYVMPCGGDRVACGIQSGKEWIEMTEDKDKTTLKGSPAIPKRNGIIDYELRRGRPAVWMGPHSTSADSPPTAPQLAWTPDSALRAGSSDVPTAGGCLVVVGSGGAAGALKGVQQSLWLDDNRLRLWMHVVIPESRAEEEVRAAMSPVFKGRAFGWFVLRADDDLPALHRPADIAAVTLRGVAEIIDNTRPDVVLVVADKGEQHLLPPSFWENAKLTGAKPWAQRKAAPAADGNIPDSLHNAAKNAANHVAAAASLAAAIQGVPVVAVDRSAGERAQDIASRVRAAAAQPQKTQNVKIAF